MQQQTHSYTQSLILTLITNIPTNFDEQKRLYFHACSSSFCECANAPMVSHEWKQSLFDLAVNTNKRPMQTDQSNQLTGQLMFNWLLKITTSLDFHLSEKKCLHFWEKKKTKQNISPLPNMFIWGLEQIWLSAGSRLIVGISQKKNNSSVLVSTKWANGVIIFESWPKDVAKRWKCWPEANN